MARIGTQYSTDATMSPLMSEQDQDPHDAMLLTKRPTSVVTQATQMLDMSPDYFGDQEDERALFSTIGADGGARRRAALAQQDDDLAADLPSTTPAAAGAPRVAMPIKASSHWKLIVGLLVGAAIVGGGSFAAVKLLRRKHRK